MRCVRGIDLKRAGQRATLALALATLVALNPRQSAIGDAAAIKPLARMAHSLDVKDEGYLRLIKSSGSLLIDEGPAHGNIPGKVRIRFVYDGDPTVTAQIAIYGHSGELLAHGAGHLSSPTSPSPSFQGALTITGGSGRYAHAHGKGQFFGVFYRRSYAITVQTQGMLSY
jgi:hypothetical protein